MNELLLATWISCQSLDLGTTIYALNNGKFREINSLLSQDTKKIFTIKVSVNVGAYLFYRKLHRKNKIIIPMIFSGTSCIAGFINLKRLK